MCKTLLHIVTKSIWTSKHINLLLYQPPHFPADAEPAAGFWSCTHTLAWEQTQRYRSHNKNKDRLRFVSIYIIIVIFRIYLVLDFGQCLYPLSHFVHITSDYWSEISLWVHFAKEPIVITTIYNFKVFGQEYCDVWFCCSARTFMNISKYQDIYHVSRYSFKT